MLPDPCQPHNKGLEATLTEKTALLRHKGQWLRPLGATPTTHIIKLPMGLVGNMQADMRTSVYNVQCR